MYNLEDVRPLIERLVLAISNSLKLEIAIFNSESQLFFCTPTYLKKKGRAVHAPFIEDVLNNGSILVNTPGEMSSCIGCRFKDHCPSTVEILCCIRAGTSVVGVADFTSFTKEGQRRINENTPLYLNTITELSAMIGEFLLNKSGNHDYIDIHNLLQESLELSGNAVILADSHGAIIRCNQLANRILSLCGTIPSSLWQLFPESVVKSILKGNTFFEKNVSFSTFKAKISTKPVFSNNRLSGILIRFSDEIYEQAGPSSTIHPIIGESSDIETVQKLISKLANSPTPILITGETGTGKELVARSIHEQSKRKKYPFVAINCSGIPENLFESELFGYEEGSFTGAKKGGKPGKFEMAQGGTLFLDELGEMPLSMQPKLLRVLQEYELERVGSTKKIQLDIRIIAATNQNLREMIQKGSFREDLFYRIGVIQMELPPLRKRREDILPISLNYIEALKEKLDTPLKYIGKDVEDFFLAYDWPGNVRELQNVVEYAANLCYDETMTLKDLPEYVVNKVGNARSRNYEDEKSEKEQIDELLDRYGYTLEGKKQVANLLGISLRTLYRKLNKSKPS